MWPKARRYYSGRDAVRAVSVAELRAMALRRLPAFVAEYLEEGLKKSVLGRTAARLVRLASVRMS